MTDLSTRGRGRAAVGFLAASVATLLAIGAGSTQAATVTVAAKNYEFQPATRTIAIGGVVRWTFAGDPHSVTSRDGLFDSGVTDPGGSFQFTFTAPGTYRYFCQVHPEQMFGTIVVRAGATPKPTDRSTPGPTARPTVRPAATPIPTPGPTPPPPTSPSAAPSPSASPPPALGVVESALPSGPPSTPGVIEPTPTSAGDGAPVVALAVIVLVAIVVGGLLVARRRGTI